ncbi:MAG: S41 family peptidase [Elusimicrobiota bacterium]|jgi:carboxyl-terminal processing protease|nr:S41 family peptidase [Elusimicrobiota bacterium]
MNLFKRLLTLSLLFLLLNIDAFSKIDDGKTYEKLKLLIDVMDIIDNHYVDETETKDLATGAIRGVVGSLDPFSQYMEEKVYKEMKTETEGSYGGVGLRIMVKDSFITVISPMLGTPAYKSGILPEDRILKINKKSAVGMSSDEAVKLMRGRAGTKVMLTISRTNAVEPLVFNLKRAKIKIETVKTSILDGKIAYIRLTEFNTQSARDIRKVLVDHKNKGIKSLILDLRNNPGGLLDSAIEIVSMFIKEKTLVLTTKGRDESIKKEYFTSGNGEFSDIPLIVLVNRGSASASEIVSGVMQDYKRALIIGNNTFGKGSVQTVIPLPDGTALRLTIAKYYLPSGRPINRSEGKKNIKNGITPDVEVSVTIEEEIKLYMQGEKILQKYTVVQSTNSFHNNDCLVEDKVLDAAIKLIKQNKTTQN